ncbi:hypothetical protein B4168_3522 [Anoxybacillus flavithermus]|nr:hypothetical protein B4168_3522 [Anoxybacillus flavithermus]OAO84650.1 hypothetical protein GT23_3501 [Parageobacillus thermoglucosidasius]
MACFLFSQRSGLRLCRKKKSLVSETAGFYYMMEKSVRLNFVSFY